MITFFSNKEDYEKVSLSELEDALEKSKKNKKKYKSQHMLALIDMYEDTLKRYINLTKKNIVV